MNWTKALALLVAVSVLAMPVPAFAQANDGATALTLQDYAAREAQAGDLEQFAGGWHGVVLTVLIVGVVVWLLWELLTPGHTTTTHHHHGDVHP